MEENREPQPAERIPHVPSYRQKSMLWWAMLCVPLVTILGLASGQLSGSGVGDPWFDALVKPALFPPGWVFGVVWTILYVMMGFALALVLASSRRGHKPAAVKMFAVQLAANLCWSPIFFGLHQIALAFFWILLMIVLVLATLAMFVRVSRLAAALLLPYLAWISFAAVLNLQFWQVN